MKKKILLLVGLCFILGMVLVGCGGSSSNIYGTWEYDHGEIDGSTYTIKELQAMEPDLFYDDVFFVIKEGGSVFYYENGQSYNQDWSQTEDVYHIGNTDATLTDDGLLKVEFGTDNYIYLKRVSTSQEIPNLEDKEKTEEPEEEATTEDSKDEEKEDTTADDNESSSSSNDEFDEDWPSEYAASKLPKYDTKIKEFFGYDDAANFKAYCPSRDDYKNYLKKLKDAGFTEDAFETDSYYYGMGEKYTVSLSYYEDDKYFFINIYENLE